MTKNEATDQLKSLLDHSGKSAHDGRGRADSDGEIGGAV